MRKDTMTRWILSLFFLIVLQVQFSAPQSFSSSQLTNMHLQGWERNGDSVFTCVLSFSPDIPSFTYDLVPSRKEISFRFHGTELGGVFTRDSTMTAAGGPLRLAHVQQENYTDGALVATRSVLTMICDPPLRYTRDIAVEKEGTKLSISVLWPRDLQARKKLYIQGKSGRGGVVAMLLGALAIAGAGVMVLLWKLDYL